MSGEHTSAELLAKRSFKQVSDALAKTAAERDRLRADLATCGKDWADERRAAQAEAAALRAEKAELVAALQKLDVMISDWAKDEGFARENSACWQVVRAALAKATATEGVT